MSNTMGRVSVAIVMVAGLTVLGDWLFYGHPVGWTLGLFVAALSAMVVIFRPNCLRRTAARVVLAVNLLLALALVESPGPLPIVLATIGVITLATIARRGWQPNPVVWLGHWLTFVALGWTRPIIDMNLINRYQRRSPNRRPMPVRGALNWVVPVALSLVFIGMFAWANPVISKWLGEAGDWATKLPEYFGRVDPIRLLFWLFLASLGWALLRHRINLKAAKQTAAELGMTPPARGDSLLDQIISPRFIVRCLVLFNLIFAVQTALDIYYFTAGDAITEGMTLKEYARRGAYPLVFTALMAAAFVLVTFRESAPRDAMKTARILVYLWLAQNALLLFTAAWRLDMYVAADQLTRLRIATVIWLGLVLMGLIYIFIRILTQRNNAWLVRINTVTALVVLVVCAFVPFDRFIADFNADRYIVGETERTYIDHRYLETLGHDSLPAIARLKTFDADHLSDRENADVRSWLIDIEARLTERLKEQTSDWRGWTWRTHRLKESLTNSSLAVAE